MRKFPIEDIKKYILYRLKFQKLPEWYSDWLSQESRLLKIAQVLEKLREIDETTASEIDDLWSAVAAAGGEGSETLIQRLESLEEYRNEVNASIISIEGEMDAISDNLNAELALIDGRIDEIEADIDLSPVFQQISTLSASVDARFNVQNGTISAINMEIDSIEDWIEDLQSAVTDLQDDPGFDPTDILAEISTIKSDILALQEQEGFDPTDILTAISTLETGLENAETRIAALENAPGGGGGGEVDIRGAAPIAVEDVESEGETWKEVSFDGDSFSDAPQATVNNNLSRFPFLTFNGSFRKARLDAILNSGLTQSDTSGEMDDNMDEAVIFRNTLNNGTRSTYRIPISSFISELMPLLPGYDASSVQTLKNISGEIQWVTDE